MQRKTGGLILNMNLILMQTKKNIENHLAKYPTSEIPTLDEPVNKKVAEEKNIKAQTKTMIAGGNNASQIHKAADGVKCLAVSVPCRYLHSQSCVVKKSDVQDVKNLVVELIDFFAHD